jgi:hypothetical protein
MTPSIITAAAQAASRLSLNLGRDHVYRGRCPRCAYGKATLSMRVHGGGIAVMCVQCGGGPALARLAGLPAELVAPEPASSTKAERALSLWAKGGPAAASPIEAYLRGRGITIPVPLSIRSLARQRNWVDGRTYSAMVSLVARIPGEGDPPTPGLIPSGIHITFLQVDQAGLVRKAATDSNKLSLGQLKHGGVWLTPLEEVGQDLAVAEGIETGLSVQQITGIPTVAALSAAGMRAFRWPHQVRRLWIAADNDEVGLAAARRLLGRALGAGLQCIIKVPAAGKNDFNDVISE